jgi:hypothetical protein
MGDLSICRVGSVVRFARISSQLFIDGILDSSGFLSTLGHNPIFHFSLARGLDILPVSAENGEGKPFVLRQHGQAQNG